MVGRRGQGARSAGGFPVEHLSSKGRRNSVKLQV